MLLGQQDRVTAATQSTSGSVTQEDAAAAAADRAYLPEEQEVEEGTVPVLVAEAEAAAERLTVQPQARGATEETV